MKMNNFEFRIDQHITGYLPHGYAVIFYGMDITNQSLGGQTFLVTNHPTKKSHLTLFNTTLEQTIEIHKDDLKKFCNDLKYPHVAYCLAFPVKKED